MQERSDVITFIFPMSQIAPRRAGAYALLVHIKYELIVRAHVHQKMLRRLRQLEDFSEVQYRHVALRTIRRSDPFRAPHFFWNFRRELRGRNLRGVQPE